jgi:hypothetical protein
MQGQHKQILKDLKQGDFDDKLAAFFAHRGESFDLDAATSGDMPVRQAEAIQPQPARSPPELESSVPVLQQPAPSAPVLDLDAAPAPASASEPSRPHSQIAPPETAQPHPIVPTPLPSRRATREIATPFSPTRPGAVPVRPVAPVVVQRRVLVGGSHPTPAPPPVPSTRVRVRRPASATPYVVREGSHPNLAPLRQAEAAPPSQPVATAPNTEPRVAAPPPPPARPGAPASNQSLDDVILAYLSQGESKG